MNKKNLLTLGHELNTSEISEVQALTPPLIKAESELELHFFLCRINATPAVKWLRKSFDLSWAHRFTMVCNTGA